MENNFWKNKRLNLEKSNFVKYEELEKIGFNLDVFEYTANLIFDGMVLCNCRVIEPIALFVNNDKTEVLMINLDANPKIEIQKIDRTKIN